MTLQERSRSPRFTSPEWTWVRCKDVQPIHSMEYGCIIDTVRGDELAIVPREYVDGMFVQGLKSPPPVTTRHTCSSTCPLANGSWFPRS